MMAADGAAEVGWAVMAICRGRGGGWRDVLMVEAVEAAGAVGMGERKGKDVL